MTLFRYKARNRVGRLITGTLEGENVVVVKRALFQQGLFPISVRKKGIDFNLSRFFEKKLKPQDLANFTRQFQVMFSVGTPMDRILTTLGRQTSHPGLKGVLSEIQEDVSAGIRLSEAFAKHPHYFSLLYTNMLAVGEAGGVLSHILKELAEILLKENRIQSKVKSAMLYPKIVMGALVAVTIVMLLLVVPTFTKFYAQFDAPLPLPTRILVAASDVLVGYWFLFLFGGGGIFYGWKMFSALRQGKRFVSWIRLKMPVFGNLHRMVANARFGHLVSSLYRTGFPLSRSLAIVAGTIDNEFYEEDIRYLKEELDKGRSLANAILRTVHFTPMVQECVAVGEQTGQLDQMLESTAAFYDEEIDDLLKNLTTLIEPILLFLIFFLVGLLALAIFLPIWKLPSAVLPH